MADAVKQRMLDRLLRIAAERAAAPSGIRFTERQLYYEVCRILAPTHRAPRRFACTIPAPLRYTTFRAALDRREVPGLLIPAPPRTTRAGRHTPEPDLFDYGLPRLLVCESDAIAQMLRANGLPMESACPVLSASDLPLDPGIAEVLARVDGTIYLLHDASPHGLTFPAQLADLTEIPEGVRVVPLGLRPRQAGTLHLTHLRGAMPSGIAAQVNSRACDEVYDSESSVRAAQEDSQAGDGFHDSESSLRPAQVESSEREGLHHEPGSSAPAARVDPCEREEPRHSLVPSTQAAQLDSWEHEWLGRGRFVEVDAVRPASLLRTVHRLVREVRSPRTSFTELRRVRTAGFLTWPVA